MKPPRDSSADHAAAAAVATALRTLDRAVAAGSADRIARNLELRRGIRLRRRRVALGALAACAIAAVFALRSPIPSPDTVHLSPPRSGAVVVTPQTQILPDGSTVELKSGAQLEVAFTSAARRVVLRSGEAHFSVRKDSSRPFVVAAGAVEVRAVGTAFSVDLANHSVAVLVTQGRVAVATPASEDPAGIARDRTGFLDAGQRTVVALDRDTAAVPLRIATVTPTETADRLAWRVRRLEFSGTPLAEVISMFNQQAGTRFALDPALGGLRLSGALRADDREALELLLRGEFGIAAEPQPDGTISLRRR